MCSMVKYVQCGKGLFKSEKKHLIVNLHGFISVFQHISLDLSIQWITADHLLFILLILFILLVLVFSKAAFTSSCVPDFPVACFSLYLLLCLPPFFHPLHSSVLPSFPGLPVCPEMTRDHIPRARDAGHFLCVTGTVIRTGTPKLLEFQREYMCAKCRHVFAAQADFEQHYALPTPTRCPSPEGCTSVKFTCLQGDTAAPAACRDYQEIKIQEQVGTGNRLERKLMDNGGAGLQL